MNVPGLAGAFLFWSVAELAPSKAQKQKWEFAERTGIHLIEAFPIKWITAR
jgi:hypothetical protein